MLTQQTISDTIYQAKWYANTLLVKLNAQTSNGEDTETCQNQFILLCKWISILEVYLDTHYDQNGDITPDTECLTETQILELVAKVKVMLGSFKQPVLDWILSTGFWDDSAKWVDSATWFDTPSLI